MHFTASAVIASFSYLSAFFHYMHFTASAVIAAFALIAAFHLIFYEAYAIFVPKQSVMTSIRIFVVSSAIIDDFAILSRMQEYLLTFFRMVLGDESTYILIFVVTSVVIVPKRNFMTKFFILIACAAIINPEVHWQVVTQYIRTQFPEIIPAVVAVLGYRNLILIVSAAYLLKTQRRACEATERNERETEDAVQGKKYKVGQDLKRKRSFMAEILILIVVAATIGSFSTLHLFIVTAYAVKVKDRSIWTDICIHVVTYAIIHPTVHWQVVTQYIRTQFPEIMSIVDADLSSHSNLIRILCVTAAITGIANHRNSIRSTIMRYLRDPKFEHMAFSLGEPNDLSNF
jgi:hypothetical protein